LGNSGVGKSSLVQAGVSGRSSVSAGPAVSVIGQRR
jgi:putative ribosome biogenesis GTPase RsgA